ncbi:MAG: MFS transporter [Gemmatimonadota bacterium]
MRKKGARLPSRKAPDIPVHLAAMRQRLPRTVLALTAVSLLTDASSEMIYPLLPLFLSSVLGASATALGAIEGAAESVAALLKLVSGVWSDRVTRRKPLVVAGYAVASVVRPLIGVAQTAWHVGALRVTDRIGKGIRSSPRDALIADAVDPSQRGAAFGLHRAGDHLGAVIGPVLAFVLLQWVGVSLRTVFLLAAIPALLSVLVLVIGVREEVRRKATAHDRLGRTALGSAFWRYLAVLFIFALGNASDAFLLLRASSLGVAAAHIPLLWAAHHVIKAAANARGGALSDRIGRRPLIITGWAVYAVVYLAFAQASNAWHVWALFLGYGLYFGLTEGVEKAFVADLVPARLRGTAFGWFNFTLGVAAFPASVIFGALWDARGPALAFGVAAGLAAAASMLLLLLVPKRVLATE